MILPSRRWLIGAAALAALALPALIWPRAAGFLLVKLRLPETKGKSLEQLERELVD